MLDDGGRIVDAGEGGNVVQRRLVSKSALRRTVQESLVGVAERHGAEYCECCILLNVA